MLLCSETIKVLHSWNLRNHIFVISFNWHLHHVCLSNHYALRGWLQQFEQILFWILCSIIFHLVQWGSVPAHVCCSRLRTIRVFQLQPEQRGLSFTCSYLFEGNAPFEEIVTVCNLPCFSCLLVDLFSFICMHSFDVLLKMAFWKCTLYM